MKVMKTASYEKLSKCKDFDKMPYNPAAVCSENIDREEEPEKWSNCVEHVKEQQKGSESKKDVKEAAEKKKE